MTIAQMRYFREVCHLGSVTKAAEALHISQPSVSSAIRELEQEFGVNLFHRVKMRLSLTREGQYFLERCEDIIQNVDSLSAHMKDLGNKRNRIRIGVPPMIGTFLFPSIFSAFHEAHPDIELEMVERGSQRIREMVMEEDLDIAIAIADPKKDVQLHTIPIISTTLLFSVDASHPLAGRASIGLEELDGQPLILFQRDSYQTTVLTSQFARLGISPKILLASGQLYTIKNMIAMGEAGTFLFREVAAMEPNIVGIPLTEPIDTDICLIWKKGRRIYSDTTKLVRLVEEVLGGTPRGDGPSPAFRFEGSPEP